MIVRTDKPIGPEQEEQLFAKLRERKRRAGTADRPLLLSGVTEIIKPELSSSDLQFLENRKFSRAEICSAFGVPEEIVATTDHNKYDVMQGARQNFIENRVAALRAAGGGGGRAGQEPGCACRRVVRPGQPADHAAGAAEPVGGGENGVRDGRAVQ